MSTYGSFTTSILNIGLVLYKCQRQILMILHCCPSLHRRLIFSRCCGLDIHKLGVTACAVTPGGRETRTFGAMTKDLLQHKQWLREFRVTHVAMESTGVYWKPIYNILEDSFTLLVVNARHLKTVLGRETDVKDTEWIADLLSHGH